MHDFIKTSVLALLSIAILLNCSNDDTAQINLNGNVPDANFEQILIDMGYDDVLDGEILIANVVDIIELSIADYDFNNTENHISDLTGIEYFTSLETLICGGHNLTTLDLSNNVNLKVLEINDLRSDKLTEFNISKNSELEILRCFRSGLSEINLSNNINLKELYIYENDLTILNLSQNINLEKVWCDGNSLSELDITNNTKLEFLDCRFMSLTSFNTSNNLQLKTL